MRSPDFIQQVRWRPRRWAPPPSASTDLSLIRQTDVRPARSVVGLMSERLPPEWADVIGEGAVTDPWEALPDDAVGGAPMNRELFLGRVEEVESEGIVATVWSWPSGREAMVVVPRDDRVEDHGAARWGDLIAIWTWQELPGGGGVNDRRFARVYRRRLTEAERASLRALLGHAPEDGA